MPEGLLGCLENIYGYQEVIVGRMKTSGVSLKAFGGKYIEGNLGVPDRLFWVPGRYFGVPGRHFVSHGRQFVVL